MIRFAAALKVLSSLFCLVVCLPTNARAGPILDVIHNIERDLEARVGFYMKDMQTGRVISHAADDRFPLNSTFKLFACGALLNRVESGQIRLEDTVRLEDIEIVDYSPAIESHIRAGHEEVSLGDACGMVLSVSDNSAANIILSKIGGPEGLTAFMRSTGDQVTRLDRWETELNTAVPGDLRDTTTPRAIATSIERLILGDVLAPASRETLAEWLAEHRIADALFRAALPENWSIQDRTGAGGYGSRSIIAVIYPPEREPIIAAFFITETDADFASRNAAVALVGAAIVAQVTNE